MISETTVRIQTYVVIGVMVGCFSLLYPRIFHPIILKIVGLSPAQVNSNDESSRTVHQTYAHSQRSHPSMRHVESPVSTTSSKRGGIMTMVLPIYGVGVVLYLMYTLAKLYGSKRRRDRKKRDSFLRQYYRDFHYDVKRGKFRMGHGSSEDGEDDEDEPDVMTDESPSADSRNRLRQGNPFDRSHVYSDRSGQQPVASCRSIYRSAESLPHDLERFLAQMNNPSVASGEDLSALRTRLEATEREMAGLLQALDSCEQLHRRDTSSSGICGSAAEAEASGERLSNEFAT